MKGTRAAEEGEFEERGVEEEELSPVVEVRQIALREPLYLMLVLPKQTGSSEDWARVLAVGGGGEEGWKAQQIASYLTKEEHSCCWRETQSKNNNVFLHQSLIRFYVCG